MNKGKLALCAVAVLGLSHTCALRDSMADDKPIAQVAKAYASPRAVFEVFREARAKQDWRTAFSCLTPELRDDWVLESFLACGMQPSNPKIVAVLKKFGADLGTMQTEYRKQYKKKHGVDLAQLVADRKRGAEKAAESRKKQEPTPPSRDGVATPGPAHSEELLPALPPSDDALLRKVVSAPITDKAGFCMAVDRIVGNGESPTFIGKLEQLKVEGNTAVGRAKKTTTIYHLSSVPGKGSQKVKQEIDATATFRFRKVKGSWLIESEE